MAQWLKVAATKADDLSFIPRTTWWKERIKGKLSSYLHMHSVAHPTPQTNFLKKKLSSLYFAIKKYLGPVTPQAPNNFCLTYLSWYHHQTA